MMPALKIIIAILSVFTATGLLCAVRLGLRSAAAGDRPMTRRHIPYTAEELDARIDPRIHRILQARDAATVKAISDFLRRKLVRGALQGSVGR